MSKKTQKSDSTLETAKVVLTIVGFFGIMLIKGFILTQLDSLRGKNERQEADGGKTNRSEEDR